MNCLTWRFSWMMSKSTRFAVVTTAMRTYFDSSARAGLGGYDGTQAGARRMAAYWPTALAAAVNTGR